ncbi:TetR/AcrR family transcriptional regulator, partial [Nocardia cyriacigeorgica]|uniref:TetR/AcrR family transcriptional regulator n=1 Tax=Nocardia cyriacigeorgica TaxID=135487 RepID=UPI0024571B8B
MPKRSERRVLLADTALALIDDYGLAQVTHRAIDAAAGVPIGTTSNYFPTRAALYEAIARRILDQQLEAEADTADGEATAEDVADYLAAGGGARPLRARNHRHRRSGGPGRRRGAPAPCGGGGFSRGARGVGGQDRV